MYPRSAERDRRRRARASSCPSATCCGSAACAPRSRQARRRARRDAARAAARARRPDAPWAHELPDVILTGQVSDDELAALYSGAHALVFPSDDEGFGLPAVEALACGTPVVACEVPALREVLGERATFVRGRRHARADRRRRSRAAPRAARRRGGPGRTPRARPGASTSARSRRPTARARSAVACAGARAPGPSRRSAAAQRATALERAQ